MKRHRLDPISLVFGLLFTGLGIVYLVSAPSTVQLRWFWPAAVIGVGVAIIASTRKAQARESSGDSGNPVGD